MFRNLAGKLGMTSVPRPRPFRLALPEGWVERPADDGSDFVNEALREQLIVSVLEVKNPPLAEDKLRESIRELVRIRRAALGNLSEGNCRFDAEDIHDDSTPVSASLRGVDTANQVCFALRFMGYPARVFTVAYYKYDCLDGSQAAEARIEALMGGLEVDGD